jgi:hypothetical protein
LAGLRRSERLDRFTLSISLNRPFVVRFANDLPVRDFTRSRLVDARFLVDRFLAIHLEVQAPYP